MRMRSEGAQSVPAFLASVPVFGDLSTSSLGALALDCSFRSMEKGDILFLQSDPSEEVYVVRHGSLSIVLHGSDGREMVINEMHSGDIFGELGVLTRKPRSTSAMARTQCQVLIIPGRAFRRLLENEPQFTIRLLEITATRLQMSGRRESALAFMDAQARLARLLLELEREQPDKGYVTISQDELAQRAGLIRQTVAKALGKWRKAGWLITGRGRVLILNRKALEDLESNLPV